MPSKSNVRAAKTLLFVFVLSLSTAAWCQFSKSGTYRPATSLPAIYQNWLDKDVHWIITPVEKAAFGQLVNDGERDEFVVQFWLRHDPTPGTAVNEFKEEHYRRIAYSNTHFAARTNGSLTARGRIYIVYGPPDAIKTQTGSAMPTQIWHYAALREPGTPVEIYYGNGYQAKPLPEGKVANFTFVDECNCNDFQLMTSDLK